MTSTGASRIDREGPDVAQARRGLVAATLPSDQPS
ncbi:MAG: hypothetical protein QOD62_727, partial [Actinomycetota bacterium]|nr:hypothetical protein [Actinomycetota bacterium]